MKTNRILSLVSLIGLFAFTACQEQTVDFEPIEPTERELLLEHIVSDQFWTVEISDDGLSWRDFGLYRWPDLVTINYKYDCSKDNLCARSYDYDVSEELIMYIEIGVNQDIYYQFPEAPYGDVILLDRLESDQYYRILK